jgi:hypothetical protein
MGNFYFINTKMVIKTTKHSKKSPWKASDARCPISKPGMPGGQSGCHQPENGMHDEVDKVTSMH